MIQGIFRYNKRLTFTFTALGADKAAAYQKNKALLTQAKGGG